ncbi:ABC transporter permease [Gordonia sp. CPCC 205333]|uniref:ABC transporter permease n=1 Tax=Gordonia sp. CPCC 205333 TaxID=3140790 RepID=UPI003AF3671C
MAAPYRPKALVIANRTVAPAKFGLRPLEYLGHGAQFTFIALRSVPFALAHYRQQCLRIFNEMAWGRGAIIVGGGTVAVLVVLGLAIGASLGIEAYAALDLVGLGSLTGVISSFGNTRELAPLAAALGFACQAGCRMTAEIGAMRISEEIDAIETLAIRSIPFVVTTRVIGGLAAIVPAYLITLILSYVAAGSVTLLVHGESSGTYYHYFDQFISGWDIIASVIKVVVFATAVLLIHGYQGFFASGGPAGVGIASGRAIRASLVAVAALNMVMTMVLWGISPTIEFTG